MNLHEYQTKQILERYGIPIPDFAVCSHIEEVEQALARHHWNSAVLKVQVHAGGRGKAGGVKIAKERLEVLQAAQLLLGMKMCNQQTGPGGIIARQILLSPLVSFDKEYYMAVTIDRRKGQACLIASPEGGVEIEEIAVRHPGRIGTFPLDLHGKLRSYHLIELSKLMGWTGHTAVLGHTIAQGLANAFYDTDASLIEINPLVITQEGKLWALDAKLSVDDNALYRQEELVKMFDPSQIPSYELQAKRYDLAYVALDGNIGCMVNGAGLAMATMDLIQHWGGKPANFLDVGGNATQDKVAEGFKIILSDTKVKAILVNIFGGIMNCITLAAGLVAAASELEIRVPLVVRMEGTNVAQGKKILRDAEMNVAIADTLDQAAQMAVAAAERG